MNKTVKKYIWFPIVMTLFFGVIIVFAFLMIFILQLKESYFRPNDAIFFGDTTSSLVIHFICSLIIGIFLFAILMTLLQYLFPEVKVFKSKEKAKEHQENLYRSHSIVSGIFKAIFPKMSKELDYHGKANDLMRKELKEGYKYFLITILFCLPFYFISLNSYFYVMEDHFYYNSLLSLKEKGISLSIVKKIEIEFFYSEGSGRRHRSSVNLNYYIIFEDGKKFELAEAGMIEVAKLDEVLKTKNIKKEYLEVENEAFDFARRTKSEKYVESMESIFSDYKNGNFK